MAKPVISIKPKNRGALHRELGVPEGENIPEGKLDAAKSKAAKTGNTTLAKRVTFAQNFAKGVVSRLGQKANE